MWSGSRSCACLKKLEPGVGTREGKLELGGGELGGEDAASTRAAQYSEVIVGGGGIIPLPKGDEAEEHDGGRGEAGGGAAGEGVGGRRSGEAEGATIGDEPRKAAVFLKHPEGSNSSEEEAGGADWALLSGAVKKSS